MKKLVLALVLIVLSVMAFAVEDELNIDQLGYRPLDAKYGTVALDKASYFRIMTVNGDKEAFTGVLQNPVKDEDSGANCYVADFSALQKEGEYYMEVDREFKSNSFTIGYQVYDDAFYKAMRGFYLQRCGCAVSDPDGFKHDACHTQLSLYHVTTGRGLSEKIDASGGWHDAGDYGRYVVNSGLSTATLLWMFERYGAKLEKYKMDLPYKGYTLPDILEEIKYNLTWMQKMQGPNGGVYHKVTPLKFPALNIMPEDDKPQEYVFEVTSCATGDFAAVMAIASRIYAKYDAEFAAKCLDMSQKAWKFLQANPAIVPPGGFKNPSDCGTGAYGDSDDRDERFWAAVELFNALGSKEYSDYIAANAGTWDPSINIAPHWRDVHAAAMISYAYSGNPMKDTFLNDKIRKDLRDHADVLVYRINQSGYKSMMAPEDFIWGSNSVALNYAINLLAAGDLLKEAKYTAAAEESLHYIFGRNPMNVSYLTGVGKNPIENIHHRPSVASGKAWPGLLAGGPNKWRNDAVLQELSFDTPPAKCYMDDKNSYAGNEIAINWNAPLCYVLAAFIK
jgi:endoglucanase